MTLHHFLLFLFKGSLIDDVVGFSTAPAAGDGSLIYHLYVSLVSSQMETVSKIYHFKLGQFCFALHNPPQEEAYEHVHSVPRFVLYLGIEKA